MMLHYPTHTMMLHYPHIQCCCTVHDSYSMIWRHQSMYVFVSDISTFVKICQTVTFSDVIIPQSSHYSQLILWYFTFPISLSDALIQSHTLGLCCTIPKESWMQHETLYLIVVYMNTKFQELRKMLVRWRWRLLHTCICIFKITHP